ncbi:hypothetical protein M1O47_01105 [Dehalococcoidia bacterium]|nr:hypothetical protein [Dehalococcoidia bacterium]
MVIAETKLARYGDIIAGLIFPPRRKTPLKASWYAIALMGVFIVGAYLNFTM